MTRRKTEQVDTPPPGRGDDGLQFALFVETVFNYGGVNVLFIDFDRGQQSGRHIFQAVV